MCNVNYRTPEGDKKFFRKFFKFVVYKPLDIKTVTYNSGGEVFLEAQVHDETVTPCDPPYFNAYSSLYLTERANFA